MPHRHALTLREVQSFEEEGALGLRLMTDAGAITCRLHPASGNAALLWVFGRGTHEIAQVPQSGLANWL